jgi:hypothetical protein
MENSSTRLLQLGRLIFVVSLMACTSALGQQKNMFQGIDVTGLVDVYYGANFSDPASRSNKLRNFDIPANQVNFSLAEITLQKKPEPIGFRLVAGFGTTSDIVHGIAPYGTSAYNAMTNIQQAYLTAVIPVGNSLTVDAGEFVTHMGNEVIESKDNWNYSRSLLFAWAIPYYHTGVRLTYPFTSNLSMAVHVVNGWNSVLDNNGEKSTGLTLNYAPTASTGIILNVIDGFEQPAGLDVGKKTVFDLILSQQMSEAFSLVLNADYGRERLVTGLPVWEGVALYGRYVVNAKSAVSVRGEIFSDREGYATGLATPNLVVMEVTGTYEYRFAESLLLRGEARYDFANSPVFDKKTNVNADKDQFTLLMGLVAVF